MKIEESTIKNIEIPRASKTVDAIAIFRIAVNFINEFRSLFLYGV